MSVHEGKKRKTLYVHDGKHEGKKGKNMKGNGKTLYVHDGKKREKHEGEWKKGKKMENEPCQKLAEACHVMHLLKK